MAEQQHRTYKNSKRQLLIEEGINEINEHGITGFSIRRVAANCNLSCATPAKHFGNKNGFIRAIIDYVNGLWAVQQARILAEYEGSIRRQIVEESVAYVRFLVQNPHYRSILMLKDDEFDNIYHKRGDVSSPTQKLIAAYVAEQGLTDEQRIKKTYVIRSLVFGAALMFDTGEIEYTEEMMGVVRTCIDREFDLA